MKSEVEMRELPIQIMMMVALLVIAIGCGWLALENFRYAGHEFCCKEDNGKWAWRERLCYSGDKTVNVTQCASQYKHSAEELI